MNNALIKDALFLSLGISHDPKNLIGDLVWMDGCRIHSCHEKAAVIADMKTKHLQATGLLHFNCRLTVLTQDNSKAAAQSQPSTTECDKEATLDMFVIRRPAASTKPTDESRLLDEIRTWAKAAGYARENVRVLEVR